MVQNSHNEMTDSEFISLLEEHGFEKKEISEIMRNFKSRVFEDVIQHVEDLANKRDRGKEGNAGTFEKVKELNDARELEKQRLESYRQDLLSKIEANRQEYQKRIEPDSDAQSDVEKTAFADAYIRIKVAINDEDEIILGFGKENTMNDLFRKLQEHLSTSSFVMRRYGHDPILKADNTPLSEGLESLTPMIEVETNAASSN